MIEREKKMYLVYCDAGNDFGLRNFILTIDGYEIFSSYGILAFRREMLYWMDSEVISPNSLIMFSESCGNKGKFSIFANEFRLPIRLFRDTIGL